MNCEKCFYMDEGKKVYYTCYCEEDRKQVLIDDERARKEGYTKINGRWIKKNPFFLEKKSCSREKK